MAKRKDGKLSPDLSSEIIKEMGGFTETAKVFRVTPQAIMHLGKTGFTWIQVEFLRFRYPHLASVRKTYDEF